MSRFSTGRVVGDVDPDFVCSICHGVLDEPVQRAECEHVFCSVCIQRWLETNGSCAACREPLTVDALVPASRFIRTRVNALQVSCKFADQGCPACAPLEHVASHEAICEFKLLPGADTSLGAIRAELRQVKGQLATLADSMNKFVSQFDCEIKSTWDWRFVGDLGQLISKEADSHIPYLYPSLDEHGSGLRRLENTAVVVRLVSKECRVQAPTSTTMRVQVTPQMAGAGEIARKEAGKQAIEAAMEQQRRLLAELIQSNQRIIAAARE